MALARIILWLGYAVLFCAAIMGLTALFSLAFGEGTTGALFLFIGVLAALFGGLMAFTTRQAPVRESTKDAMIFLLLFWLATPIVLCIPFKLSGVTPDWTRAYFEAVSAFTTTGASTLVPEDLPRSFLIWRSLLQFCGGVVSATLAVVILAALNLKGSGIHKSKLFTLRRGELFPRLIAIGRIVGFVYLIIASACFALLLVSGTSLFNAFCLSLSAVSTGGLTPESGGLSNYVGKFGVMILAITCAFGAANIALVWDFLRLKTWRGTRRMLFNLEHRGMFVMMAVIILFGASYAGLANLFPVIIEAIFLVTTTGFNYEVIGIDIVPPSVLIMTALVGGAAISTAGGLKVIRLVLLLSHAVTDVDRLSHPSRVKLVHYKGQALPDRAFMSVWMYFFGYTLVFGVGTFALGVAGAGFPIAVSASAAALSNVGPLLEATFPLQTYAELNSAQLSILSALMLLGRVEVLAAMAAFTPSLWKN